jgi:hypothetical protein
MKKQTLKEEVSRIKNMMGKLINESELWDRDSSHMDSTDPLDYDDPRDSPNQDEEEDLNHIDVELVARKVMTDDQGYMSDNGHIESYVLDLFINGEKVSNYWGFDVENVLDDRRVDIFTITHPITKDKIKIWVGDKEGGHKSEWNPSN